MDNSAVAYEIESKAFSKLQLLSDRGGKEAMESCMGGEAEMKREITSFQGIFHL